MTKLASPIQVSPQDLYTSSTVAQTDLGAFAYTADGRRLRYALVGGTALVAGKLYQNAAETTAWENLTAVAASVGDTQIASSSTITVTANQLAGGQAIITVTPGVGQMYQISGHSAYTAAAPTLNISDPIRVALTTTSRIDLIPSPFSNIVVHPTTATGMPVGVALFAAASATYCWIQSGGIASVLADGAITVGVNVSTSNAVAGAIEAAVTAQAACGYAMTGIADTEYGAVKLTID